MPYEKLCLLTWPEPEHCPLGKTFFRKLNQKKCTVHFGGMTKRRLKIIQHFQIPYYIYLFKFSIFVLKIYFIFSCMCAWVCMCVFHKHRRLWRSEGVSDLWGLELQAVVNCWTWVLDLTSGFLQEKHIHRTAKPSLRPPKWENKGHLFFKIWIIIFKIQHVIEFFISTLT